MGRCNIEFFQGETISFRLQGDDKIRLEDWEFTLSFVRGAYVLQVKKEDCEVRDGGVFYCVIDAERSRRMPVGVYDVEIMLEGEISRIAVANNVFLIKESVYGE